MPSAPYWCCCANPCGCGATNPTRWKLTLTGATLPKIAAEFQNAFGEYECLRHILLDPCIEDIDGEYVTERVSPTDACFHRAKFAPCMWAFAQESSFGSQHQSYYLVADVTTLRYNEGDVWFGEGDPPPPGVYGTVRFYTVGYGDNTYEYCDSCGAGGVPLSYSAELATLWYSRFTIPDVEGVPADCREIGEISLTNTAPAWCGSFKPDVDIFPPGTTVTIEPVPADDETEPVEFSTDVSPCTDCQPEPAILKLHYPLIPCSEGGLTNLWVSYETKNADLDYTTAMFDGECYTVSEVAPTELDALPEGAIIIDALTFENCAECGCGGCAGKTLKAGAIGTGVFQANWLDRTTPTPTPDTRWNGGWTGQTPWSDTTTIDVEWRLIDRPPGQFIFEGISAAAVDGDPIRITVDCVAETAVATFAGKLRYASFEGVTPVPIRDGIFAFEIDDLSVTFDEDSLAITSDPSNVTRPAIADGQAVTVAANLQLYLDSAQFCEGG